jgi:hypothetical protein
MSENKYTVKLSLLLPVAVVGLVLAVTCGAPDEVRRVGNAHPTGGTGGNSSISSSSGTAGVAGSTTSTPPVGGSSSPASAGSSGSPGGATGGASSEGGISTSGGASTTGGRGGIGGTSATGGRGGTGGTGTGGAGTGGRSTGGAGGTGTGGASTGGSSGTGGATSPFGGSGGVGGTGAGGRGGTGAGGTGGIGGGAGGRAGSSGGAGGATGGSTGGTVASGGAGGSSISTSTTPPPTNGLGVWVAQKTTGGPGQIALSLRIDNKTAQTVDVSTVTLRYWYRDEGLGTNLVLAANYVSIGYSNQGKVTSGTAAANPSPVTGADHYLELAFTGTLAAQGDKSTNDQFNIQVTLHTAGYTGAVDVTNDYSYDGGAAAAYEQKITLHDKSGKVVWGTAP